MGQKCYPSGGNKVLEIIGYVLLVVGIILLFCSMPGWVWTALIGLVLIVAGFLLIRFGK